MKNHVDEITISIEEYADLIGRLSFAEGALRGMGVRLRKISGEQGGVVVLGTAEINKIAFACDDLADEVVRKEGNS